MKIAVASGKGGTGKTTLSLALAGYLANRGYRVSLMDCDVEEPNVNLFLKANIRAVEQVSVPIPVVDGDKCTGCGLCERICAFNAIAVVSGKPLIFKDICHSCGGCMLVCPERAIREVPKEIGDIEEGSAGAISYIGGRLRVGEAISPPLIGAVRKHYADSHYTVIDAPPGTSCPVMAAVRGCDAIVLVTEPTPFGLHDLKLAVETMKRLDYPLGVVINRAGMGDDGVERYCAEEGISVLASLAHSREIAEKYAAGEVVEEFIRFFDGELGEIVSGLERLTGIRAVEVK